MKQTLKKLYKFLRSIRLAVALFAILIPFISIGVFVPQEGRLSPEALMRWREDHPILMDTLESLGLSDIYASWPMIATLLLLLANTSANAIHRVGVYRKQLPIKAGKRIPPSRAASQSQSTQLEISLPPEEILSRLRRFLKRRRYAFEVSEDGLGVRAVKNRYATFGSLLFHFSFVGIALGAIISIATRFSGVAVVAEGESFKGAREAYISSSQRWWSGDWLPNLKFKVERLAVEYAPNGHITGAQVEMADLNRPGHRESIRVNYPFRSGDTQVRLSDFGLTPLWTLIGPHGRPVDGAFVKLNVYPPGREDRFVIPQGPYEVFIQWYPDLEREGDRILSKTKAPNNPHLYVKIFKEHETVYDGLLKFGQRIRLDGSYRLAFPEWRYWGHFEVNHDAGKFIVLAALTLGCFGVSWRLLGYRRFLIFSLETGEEAHRLHVGGKSDYYKLLYQEEFSRLTESLRKEIES